MAGNNNQIPEHMAEDNQQYQDGLPASATRENQDMNMDYKEYVPEHPQIPGALPLPVTEPVALPQGAPMQDIMAALVNAINRQSDMILQQNQKFKEQNVRLEAQSRWIDVIAESRITMRSQNHRNRRSPTLTRSRSFSRITMRSQKRSNKRKKIK
ncbi:hypothetical protein A2U01_0011344 [Trifolium medium]|uniref:Uncharacterized protein n=1 Tax=Trifolium medium TaxID=97028 RepID=A0A392MUR7_9FABA|nr:hypothetical protein [Trifolium medium]